MSINRWQQAIIDGLTAANIDHFLHVPGGPLGPIIAHFEQDPTVVELPVGREEEGVGILSGLVLAGKKPVLIMQDNGIGNSIGMLATLANAYHIPGLILSFRRGGITEYNSAMHTFTEHVPNVVAAVGIKAFTLHQSMAAQEWAERIPLAYAHSYMTHRPVLLHLEMD